MTDPLTDIEDAQAQRDIGISFHSEPPGASFQCTLNSAAWSACARTWNASPVTT